MKKTILIWKRIDLAGQYIMLALPILLVLFLQRLDQIFFLWFTLGVWQIGSATFHSNKMQKMWIDKSRQLYNKVLIAILIFGSFSLLTVLSSTRFNQLFLIEGFAMLFLGIAMGIWYLVMTERELRSIEKVFLSKG